MSKRRTKKEQRALEDGIKAAIFLVAGLSYLYTKSLLITGIFVGVAFALILGIIIFQNKREAERLRSSGIKEIDAMDGIQFEYYLKQLYLTQGYAVEVTNASGDYGGDLLLKKDGVKFVVQAKRYSKDVGIKAVQEVIGAKSYYSADEAWVVSNSYFTKAARDLADKSDVRLVDRDRLIDSILAMNSDIHKPVLEEQVETIEIDQATKCIKCGSDMVVRKGKRGAFLGCNSFPRCRFTMDIKKSS